MDKEKIIKYLEERKKYAHEKSKKNEENELIRQAEWYDGYEQAFMEVIDFLKNN